MRNGRWLRRLWATPRDRLMARSSRINSLLAMILVAISFPFYGVFRPDTWLGVIVRQTGIFRVASITLGTISSPSPPLRIWNDAFPSFIWVFAFTVLMSHLWGGVSSGEGLSEGISPDCSPKESLRWILLPCIVNTLWECGQYTYIICGTGSLADILAGWAAVLLFIVLQRR